MSLDTSQFRDLFLSEAEDHIQRLNDNMLLLEKHVSDKKILEELMRSSHTLKSSSATMGYKDMAYLTHVMEDIFDYARHDIMVITPKIIDTLFAAVDKLEQSMNSVQEKGEEVAMISIIEKVKKVTGVSTVGVGKSQRDESGKPVLNNLAPAKDGGVGKKVRTRKKKGDKSDTVVESNKKHKESVGVEVSDIETEDTFVGVKKITHIKVPIERLDTLFDRVEELLIDNMRLKMLVSPSATHFSGLTDQEVEGKFPLVKALRPTVDHLGSLVSSIQHHMMQARLVPLHQVFARFPRMVRDLAAKQGKDIVFLTTGNDLELDRSLVDTLGEPLLHLLRNAVDHGVEKKGKITLSAKREKNVTSILVEDDGVGIDWSHVIESAKDRGIISDKDAQVYAEDYKSDVAKEGRAGVRTFGSYVSLIFHPNLSTNKKVTETSGRGVGLSVVDQFAKNVGGRMYVTSPLPDGGTRFSLELPQSLAITKALLVQVGDRRFALPFDMIDRSVRVSAENIKKVADQDVAVVQGVDIPLVYLEEEFSSGILSHAHGVPSGDESVSEGIVQGGGKKSGLVGKKGLGEKDMVHIVILVHHRDFSAGLVVHKLIGEQEIVVKGLPGVLKGTRGFSGSTVLGDGQSVLIIDAPSILENILET